MSTVLDSPLQRKPVKPVHLDCTTAEWPHAWDALARLSGDYADCTANGECWQYMGTFFLHGGWFHQFRHRNRPATANRTRLPKIGRVTVDVPARAEFSPE